MQYSITEMIPLVLLLKDYLSKFALSFFSHAFSVVILCIYHSLLWVALFSNILHHTSVGSTMCIYALPCFHIVLLHVYMLLL